MLKKRLLLLLYVLVMTIIVFVFTSPILILLINSMKADSEILGNPFGLPRSLSFSHYNEVWQAMNFPGALFRTIFITFTSVAGIVLFASMAAYVLGRIRSKVGSFFYSFFIFSLLIPVPSILFPLVLLSGNLGLNNMAGIILIYWGLGCPLALFIFYSFIKGLPPDYEDAAALDGAGFFPIFFLIVLPVLKPAIITVIIINIFWIWNDFLLPLVLLPPGTTIQLAQFGFLVQSSGIWGPAAASLVLASLPLLIFFIVLHKYILKTLPSGALKG